ncbi:sce7726 family protein [Pararhizobium sp. BT-229]|uniref:sce7726 family protein n=1 Tax=Pararhizobium sp. BT-229 TaxID=2986923 RepID=UPI0021F7E105|nr:sce7726 family protein [Pararhizobium sp. BT-229]MCV9964566.1 sce7726 family protein [Pararhizobium sp. BT-229]
MLDPDIRHPLANLLRPPHGCGSLLCEVGLWGNTVRIDLARLTATRLEGFEIKSDGDTLARLARQAEIYSLVLDTATLVGARRHIDKAASMLPGWWGLTEATPAGSAVGFSVIRPPLDNPAPSAERVAGLLWKDEALALLRDLGETRGLSRLRLAEAHALIADCIPLEQVRAAVFGRLAARRDWIDRHDPFFAGPFRPRAGAV